MIKVGVAIPSLYHPERFEMLQRCIKSLYESKHVASVVSLSLNKYPIQKVKHLKHMVDYCTNSDKAPAWTPIGPAHPDHPEGTRLSICQSRNIALSKLHDTDFVVHCDDDCWFDPMALVQFARVFASSSRIGCITPAGMHIHPCEPKLEGVLARAYIYNGACWAMNLRTASGKSFMGMDHKMWSGEDYYHMHLAWKQGKEHVITPAPVVHHEHHRKSGFGPQTERYPVNDRDSRRLAAIFETQVLLRPMSKKHPDLMFAGLNPRLLRNKFVVRDSEYLSLPEFVTEKGL